MNLQTEMERVIFEMLIIANELRENEDRNIVDIGRDIEQDARNLSQRFVHVLRKLHGAQTFKKIRVRFEDIISYTLLKK